MKVLVTGSTGFIGKHLVKELKKTGFQVKEFSLSEGKDLLNREDLKQELFGVQAVIHLAALLDETKSLEELRKVNVLGTENLLKECAEQRIEKFIYLSTTGVYGDIKEKANELTHLNPLTGYEKSKTEAEKIVLSFQELVPITVIRSPIVYGPNTYWRKIISLVKKGFPIIGLGENKMQLIYFKDLVDAIIFLLKSDEAIGETFIVASDEILTYKQVHKIIAEKLGIPFKEKHMPIWIAKILAFINLMKSKIFGKESILIPSHIDRLLRLREYDLSKIHSLGWKSKHFFKEGIRETILELNL